MSAFAPAARIRERGNAEPRLYWLTRAALVAQSEQAQGGPAVSEQAVYLTFDDGPDPRWTPQILELLAQAQMHATFFAIGDMRATRTGAHAAHRMPPGMRSAITRSAIDIPGS